MSTSSVGGASHDTGETLPFKLQSGHTIHLSKKQLDMTLKDFLRYFRANFRQVSTHDEDEVKVFRRRYQLRKSSKKGRDEQRERQRQLEIQVQEASKSRLSVDKVLDAIGPVVQEFIRDPAMSNQLLRDMSRALNESGEYRDCEPLATPSPAAAPHHDA